MRVPVRVRLETVRTCGNNDWYNDVHLPDVLATGLFHTTYRYQALSPGPGEGKYMAIYETDIPDPDAAVKELMSTFRPLWRDKGRAIDIIQNTRRGIYKRLYPPAQ